MHQSFFRIVMREEVWEKAQWKAVAFLVDPYGVAPPTLSLVFGEDEVGKQIFQEWQSCLGERDFHDGLTVSIRAEEDPLAYSVTLTCAPAPLDFEPLPAECRPRPAEIKRVLRLPRDPYFTQFSLFQEAFAKHGRFYLVPSSATDGGITSLHPHFEYALEKTQLHFLPAAEE